MAGTSFNLSTKISGYEAVAWTSAVLQAKGILLTTEEVTLLVDQHRPTDFKNPRKPRSSKISSSSSERSEQEYDPTCCPARLWCDGLGGQCSSKLKDGASMCSRHQKIANKHGGVLENGFFNGPRPTHHFFDESLKSIPWADIVANNTTSDSSDKPKKAKQLRKCSLCGCLLYTSPSPRDRG